MVGFYDFSDTDNESAIEEIISQAQDACVLDQLSAINCAGITNSVLPSHLETRFRNLKSFPPTKARTFPTPTSRNEPSFNFSSSKQNPDSGYTSSHDKKGVEEKAKDESVSSPPFTPSSSEESSMSSIFKPAQKNGSKQHSPLRSSGSPSPSPPRRRGCLWCSPKKKEQKKKGKENWGDEILSSLGSFSMKEQQKILKKAMKEEEKVSREAEKIVQWAKQASSRMKASDIDDELSD
ncbi:hypothetical protein DEO72_LG4g1891 [Vigna unguiculata]|uniref:Hepatoma-derived growth factor-related protein 2-like n=1 Tax=Vigna unguiculata TaxID=3917 RepID=A0A4D6LQZ5_VIGUN|nr:hypothetical protein DEO72_LG4g1891 [Vigna unguiculata]